MESGVVTTRRASTPRSAKHPLTVSNLLLKSSAESPSLPPVLFNLAAHLMGTTADDCRIGRGWNWTRVMRRDPESSPALRRPLVWISPERWKPRGLGGHRRRGRRPPSATLDLCRKSDRCLVPSGCPWDPTIWGKAARARRAPAAATEVQPVRQSASRFDCQVVPPASPERQGDGLDLLVVRELTGSLYFKPNQKTEDIPGGQRAVDTMVYTSPEVERIAHVAAEPPVSAGKSHQHRQAKCSGDGILWRGSSPVAGGYADVTLEHMFVDNAADATRAETPPSLTCCCTEPVRGRFCPTGRSPGPPRHAAQRQPRKRRETAPLASMSQREADPDIAGKNLANPVLPRSCLPP